MATALKNLSSYNPSTVPHGSRMKFAVVVSEWNEEVTNALRDGAIDTLLKHGVKEENIIVRYVPGSFELVAGCRMVAENTDVDGVIAIGCVVRGDTPHFDYICQGVTQGLAQLNAQYPQPFIYGLLTTNNMQQAFDRCGGVFGNKGTECAITAIKMVDLACSLK